MANGRCAPCTEADVARRVADRFERQFGVAHTGQLRSDGLSSTAITRWTRRSHLFRTSHGVYCSTPNPASFEAECLAAAYAGGPDALVSGLHGASLHRVTRIPPAW